MKNKIFYIFVIIFFFITHNYSLSLENDYNFETQRIEIQNNGNLIKAYNGKAIDKNENFEITAENFEYFRNLGILKINGSGVIIDKKKKIKIEFNEGKIDQKNYIFETFGETLFKNQNINLDIKTEKLNLDYKNDIIYSNTKSKINDAFQNIIDTQKFEYDIKEGLIKFDNLILKDNEGNTFEVSKAYLNIENNNLLGKDLSLKLNKNDSFNEENQPRIKGNSVINTETNTSITGGVFTTCKKRDGCPPWQISAKNIKHEKDKKVISYKDAILKIYNFPVAYFPRFYHPDPTVERQSGFLTPSYNRSTNKTNFVELPYYFVISDNKDTTFSPRFYNNEQFLLQNEFRSVTSKSNHISDISFKIDDYEKLKSHFFYDYSKFFTFNDYADSDFKLRLQKTSKDTYLKKNKIKSKIDFNNDVLENSAVINFSKDDTIINLETHAYENLSKIESDRYEYIFPKINMSKKIDNNTILNGDFLLNTKIINKSYNTNIFETINTNDLKFESIPKISEIGFYNNYEFLLRNTNTDGKNSKAIKNQSSSYVSGLMQLNSSIPLIKQDENSTKILRPKFSFKIAPNYTKDVRDENNIINIDNIYSFDRYSEQDTVEGGASLTYGSEYSIFNKKKSLDVFNLKIANNLRLKENNDLQKNSQFDEQVSSIVNEILIRPSNNFDIKYESSIKNNFSDINYEHLVTNIKINNIITSFDYYNQNENSSENAYLSNTTTLNFNKSNFFSFKTRKNQTKNITEYYNLAYTYTNDCLTASIEYNKDYYSDRDIKPDEGLFLKFSIIPNK